MMRGRRELDGLDAEIRHHIDEEIKEHLARGMAPDEARRAALLKFGSITRAKEDARDVWVSRWCEDLWSDLKYGARSLLRSPGLTLGVIIAFACGIGANTAMFSVVNEWLFRPLAVPDPEQIVVFASVEEGRRDALISFPNFADLRAQSGSAFSDVFAFAFRIAGLNAAGVTRQFVVGAVSGNYFAGLRVNAIDGRVFRPGEGEASGDNAAVVVSYGFWKRQLGGDPSVIGRPVAVNGKQATIIGIAPESFQGTLFGFPLDGYVTLNTFASGRDLLDRSNRGLNVLARRKPGVTLEEARASIDVIARRLAHEYPDSNAGVAIRVIRESSARPVPLVANFVRVIAGLFLFLPALLLLMACLNVTGIILARGEMRGREMAVRASLGGGRGRLIRQLLAETLLLSAFGTLAGIVLGAFCVRVAGNYVQRLLTSASNYSLSMDAGLDGRVFAYALLCTATATGLTGLWPGLRASRVDVRGLLSGSGGTGHPPNRRRMYKALVIVQLAGSAVLLVVSALFVRSVDQARHIDLGFDPRNVVAVMVDPGQLGYDSIRTNALYRDLRERFRAVPGVQSVGIAQTVPLTFLASAAPVYVEGMAPPMGQTAPSVSFNIVDENYLKTMRTPIVSGRGIEQTDVQARPNVAVINETMARRLWPDSTPIGKRFSLRQPRGDLFEVVGVATDGQYKYLSSEPQSFFYLPTSQSTPSARTIVIRTGHSPESTMPLIRDAVRTLEPNLLISNLMTMEQVTQGLAGFFLLSVAATLSGFIGLLGLGLAVVGTYGVVAYGVNRRQREFGIRRALGAGERSIQRLVLVEGARMAVAGVGTGLLLALIAKKGIERLLVGVSSADPLIYAAICVALIGIVLVASYMPARRGSRMKPVDALRGD